MDAEQPDAGALLSEALRLHRRGQLTAAEECYRQVLSRDPRNADALHLLGMLALSRASPLEAEKLIRDAIAIDDAVAAFHSDLAIVLREQKRYGEALVEVGQALELSPGVADAHFVRASIHQAAENWPATIEACERLVALDPNYFVGYQMLSAAAMRLHRLERAISAAEAAVRLRPDSGAAHWNLALALLTAGQLERGWEHFERQMELGGPSGRRRQFRWPLWRRQDVSGKRVLLYCEGGFGDALHFARYVPMVAKLGARVTLQCPHALRALFANLPGVERIVAPGEGGDFDFACPLQSLPYNFRTTLANIPTDVPYLRADETLVQAWGAKLAAAESSRPTLRVGLTWAGSANPRDRRSRSLALFASPADVPGVEFVSLQVGPEASQAASPPASMTLLNFTDDLVDFAETGALIANLDLVITVDTSVAHLAAALAKPTWILLPHAPDFRWMLDRTDSPWYPTVRLFRQSNPREWASVIAAVKTELQKLTDAR